MRPRRRTALEPDGAPKAAFARTGPPLAGVAHLHTPSNPDRPPTPRVHRRGMPYPFAMKCVLTHRPALLWYLRQPDPRREGARTSRTQVSGATVPPDAAVKKLQWFLDLEDVPLEFLVSDPARRRKTDSVRTHLCRAALPGGSLLPIPGGIDDIDLYIASPELLFALLAQQSSIQEAIYTGMCLCSDFRLDPVAPSGVVTRTDGPLTTRQRIGEYLNRAPALKGIGRARQALPHLRDHARSPKECGLGMLFGLPHRLGGFALGSITFNPCIRVREGTGPDGRPRMKRRYPDILITARGQKRTRRDIAADYDSDSEHRRLGKVSLDARRRNAIATVDRLVHYSLTTSDAQDFSYLKHLSDQMRRQLGVRAWPELRTSLDSHESRLKIASIEKDQFDLWRRFVLNSPL